VNSHRLLEEATGGGTDFRPCGPLGRGWILPLILLFQLLSRASWAQDSTFLLATTDPARSPSPFVGNGHFSTVIPVRGIGPALSLMAGLYEHAPTDVPRIVGIPAWNAIDVFDGDHWLGDSAQAGDLRDYRQVIDMRTGTARTSYIWAVGGKETALETETFISRADQRLAGTRVTVSPKQTGQIRVRFALTGWPPPKRLALAKLTRAEPNWGPVEEWYPGQSVVRSRAAALTASGGRLSMSSSPVRRRSVVLQSSAITWPTQLPGAVARRSATGDTAMIEIAFDALAGQTYTFSQVVTVELSTGKPSAQRDQSAGYDRVAAASAAAWGRRWETDIQIEGDPGLQRVVRSMLFYLLCSADSGTRLGIPPMGLSSGGYYGHIFWDSDTWMFPALLLSDPDVAHSLVAFRARTLPGARKNAAKNGLRGAMYPWEADELGNETTPRFAAQNASSEIHVNGDVALAQWQYYLATGDSAWLASEGFPVIRETASFWLSRVTHDSTNDSYHIKNVVSVSEGLVGVTDDAYTNAVARKNLEIAAAATRKLGLPADPRWTDVATKLHLPFDPATQVFRTYEGAPDSTLGDVTPLLAYPLRLPMSDQAKRSTLEPAARKLMAENQGALMGAALLSVNAAELRDKALVDSLLPHSYQSWLQGPFLMLSETPTNKAVNFLTGAGSFLQQVIFGWTGLRIGDGGVEPAFPPMLPSTIKRLVLRNFSIRGQRYDITVDATGRHITPSQSGNAR
jgi:trehalose/maltose hydrolase-like predicted phosphorylase